MTTRLTDRALLRELEPQAESNLERHLRMAEEWFPHLFVPYGDGRDFDTEPWTPDQPRLTGVAQTAFYVNLLTEDNLPSYHREIHQMFALKDSAWTDWVHRWTAEEGRHSIVLRDYLTVTRNLDPVKLERGRMQTMSTGYDKDRAGVLHGLCYVAFQELATRVSHRNTGRYSEDPVADRIMARIAVDENLHMIFYRDLVSSALHLDPSSVIEAITDEVVNFEMPGSGIDDFQRMAVEIAKAGIYDLRSHHDDVIWPLLRHWGVFEAEGLDANAERKREELTDFLEKLERMAIRFEEKRAAREQRQEPASSPA